MKPFERLRDRKRPVLTSGRNMCFFDPDKVEKDDKAIYRLPGPKDLLFPMTHRELFNTILDELDLKCDREGTPRTAYSLRHTYICFRLMEGADIYQIAKNCRTSVEMIEKYYASHIKNSLNAAAINVRRARPRKGKAEARADFMDAE